MGSGRRAWWRIGRWVVFAGLLAAAWLTNCSDPLIEQNKPPETPSNPTPSDNAITSIVVKLEWRCSDPNKDPLSYDVHFGTDTIPPLVATNYTSASYSLDTLEYDTHYYWKVVAKDNQGSMAIGPVWKFKTRPKVNQPPDAPWNPTPSHTQTGVLITTSLSWASSDPDGDPLKHDVYLDTSNPPVTMVAEDTSATIIDPPGELAYGTDYFWRVVVRDTAQHDTVGDVWTFRTADNQAPNVTNVSPINGATDLNPLTLQLTWEASDPEGDALTCDVALDTLLPPMQTIATGVAATTFNPKGLIYGKQYYWRIQAKDTQGNVGSSAIWTFTLRSPLELSVCGGIDTIGRGFGVASFGDSWVSVASRDSGAVFLGREYPCNLFVASQYNPRRKGGSDYRRDVAVVESSVFAYAFLAADTLGLYIIKYAPEGIWGPDSVGGYNTPGVSQGIAIEGNYAYLADGWGGLWIFDIRDPENLPSPVNLDTGWADDVAVSSGYVYVAAAAGLVVVDARDPEHPYVEGELPIDLDPITGVAVSGQFVYVVGWGFLPDYPSTNLFVIDVSDPTAPVHVGSFVSRGGANGVSVAGSYAYMAYAYSGVFNRNHGVNVIDISEPTKPRLAAFAATVGPAQRVAIAGDYIYVACDAVSPFVAPTGFQVIDQSPLE